MKIKDEILIVGDRASVFVVGDKIMFYENSFEKGNYFLSYNQEVLGKARLIKCSFCDSTLEIHYSYIIDMLKRYGLLPKNFKPICCDCMRKSQIIREYEKDIQVSNASFL